MNQTHTTRFSTRLRLLCGLALLLGLLAVTGGLARPAHAQSNLSVSDCSSDAQLQADVTQANSDNAGDIITFACSGDIKLSSTLTINGSMTLSGSGQQVTLDGGDSVRVLFVQNSLTLNALTIAHGSIPNGNGGGLYNYSTVPVTISNSTFAYNSAPGGSGGGLYNEYYRTVSISNSTFAYNSAANNGGGIYNYYRMTITNSTIANNSASNGSGGGLYNNGGLDIRNGTIANNSASNGHGGGLYNQNQGSISGSMVAANTGGDCANSSGNIGDWGYNLSSDSSCGFTGTGSVQNTDPKLGPLASNGGPTQTMALLSSSPAINQIPSSACLDVGSQPLTADQRGITRPQGAACDMGAFEFRVPVLTLPNTITTSATSPQGAVVSYTATASEPDDASATPTVSCAPVSGSNFPIGSTTVQCSASDSASPADSTSGSFQVVVNPTLTVSVNSQGFSPKEGTAYSGVVANVTDYGPDVHSASIDWGDGSSSAGTISFQGVGNYGVTGSHTYTEEGSFAIKVTVNTIDSRSATGTGSVTVADAALSNLPGAGWSANGLNVYFQESFMDADPNGTLSDYSASVSWGDGSTSVACSISCNPFSSFALVKKTTGFGVGGSHKYGRHGSYSISVTITDAGGSRVSHTIYVTF
jgi:hypothetical protein